MVTLDLRREVGKGLKLYIREGCNMKANLRCI